MVQGNRFDLSLSSGKVDNVTLSEGTVEIPQFKPDGGLGIFKARAVGDAHEIMAFLDKPPLRLFSPNGFAPDRISGQADLKFEVDRLDAVRGAGQGLPRELSGGDSTAA